MNLKAGEQMLSHYSISEGTEEILRTVLPSFGIDCIIADLRDITKAEEVLKADPSIRMLYLETPATPTIQCVDLDELSKIAKAHQLIVACDNTFATPYLQ